MSDDLFSGSVCLGIDPGSRFTGFGVIEQKSSFELKYVTMGLIKLNPKLDFVTRLGLLSEDFESLIKQIKPDCVSLERIFLGKNVDSAFKLGHVRGVIQSISARHKIPVFEYAPQAVKKGVAGHGQATKESVRSILMKLFNVSTDSIYFDDTDALSLAYFHCMQSNKLDSKMKMQKQIKKEGLM